MQPIARATWTADETALHARIEAHAFARPGQVLDFTGRLAREIGWSRTQAEAAIGEYRRFCFLAMTGGGPTTPSEEVDAVWHLHLTYSRDYWEVWCREVLRGALHHDPTQGGPAEQARYREQYVRTLARYEAYFGAPDPAFWPGTLARFRRAARYRTVDTGRVLVL
ncbi:glycine-rich domain-containing protein, partial [Methylobacterium trifolii]